MKKTSRKTPRVAEASATYGEVTVGIADLKARLSEHLRAVRQGGSLTILDRNTPIARIVPMAATHDGFILRPAIRAWKDVRLPPPLKLPVDSTTILLELRKDRF